MDTFSFKIEKGDSAVKVKVNAKVYPISVVYGASYVFIDRCYVLLDGNPELEVIVELRPKKEEDLEILARDFFNELLNYAFYENQSKKNSALRETLLKAALLSNVGVGASDVDLDDTDWSEIDDLEEEEFDDPEGIAVPWEEKYGESSSVEGEKVAEESVSDVGSEETLSEHFSEAEGFFENKGEL